MRLAGLMAQEGDSEVAGEYRIKAKRYYQDSVDQNGYLPGYLALIRLYNRAGMQAQALQMVEQMLAFSPHHYRARIEAARTYMRTGNTVAALENATAAMSLIGHDDRVRAELLELLTEIQ